MLCYVPNHSKHSKTTKVIKLRWIASIWRQNDTKMLSYVPNHSKHSKTTKVIKLRWIGSIWRQNDKKCWVTSQTIPNTAKLQKWSNYDELHRFDVKTNKNVELRPKPFETQQNYKSDQITMNCIDLTSKRTKMLSYVANHSKQRKTYKSNQITMNCIDLMSKRYVELRPKPFKTTQNYKSDQITMNCIDLTSKRSKMLSYVPNHSKQRKTTKVIKLRWIASIWRQNDQKCWVTSQTIPNTQNYKSDQITMNCIDLTSKRSKMLSYVPNHSNNAKLQKWSNYDELHRFDVKTIKMLSYVPNHSKHSKTTKVIKLQWIASIWRQNDQKCWVTSETIPNTRKTTKVIKLRWIASIWRQNDTKMLSYVPNHSKQRKPTKRKSTMNWSIWCQKHQTTQNYKSDQITMKCMDLTSKRTKMLSYVPNHSKQRKTTKVIKLRWIASIWRQNEQKCWVTSQTIPNNSKTTKVIKLRWIASIWRQNDKKCWVTSQTIQNNSNYKSNQITMNCIDLMSKTSNNAKLQKWSNYDEVHGFDVKTNKNVELRPKPFKTKVIKSTNCIDLMSKRWKCWVTSQTIQTTQNYKSDQITMNCIDLTSKRSKMLSYVPNHSKQRKSTKVIKVQWIASIWCQNDKNVELQTKHSKTTKVIKLRWIASIWRQNDQKCWVTSQTIQNKQTYKSIKLRWIASIWCQKHQTTQNYKSDQITMKLHGFDVKTNKNVELRPKPFKTTQTYKSIKLQWIASIWCQKHQTTQNYKSDQITMKCMDLTSKRTKMLSYVPNHSKQRKTTKVIKLQWIASIWCQNDKKCWVTSQTIPNTAKLQKWSNYDELHRFDVKTIKNVELRPKPFKTQQNYKSDQITMNCIDLTSKR